MKKEIKAAALAVVFCAGTTSAAQAQCDPSVFDMPSYASPNETEGQRVYKLVKEEEHLMNPPAPEKPKETDFGDVCGAAWDVVPYGPQLVRLGQEIWDWLSN